MSKDDRIVVRMSAELRTWVHEQAQLGEQDDAAFVRMVLSNTRRGTLAALALAPAPAPLTAKPVRDVLDVSSMGSEPEPVTTIAEDQPQAAAHSIDVDALVADTLDQAVAEGLTEPQIEAANGEPPPAGVRSLFRRPTPFSPGGNQLARIEQYLGSQ